MVGVGGEVKREKEDKATSISTSSSIITSRSTNTSITRKRTYSRSARTCLSGHVSIRAPLPEAAGITSRPLTGSGQL